MVSTGVQVLTEWTTTFVPLPQLPKLVDLQQRSQGHVTGNQGSLKVKQKFVREFSQDSLFWWQPVDFMCSCVCMILCDCVLVIPLLFWPLRIRVKGELTRRPISLQTSADPLPLLEICACCWPPKRRTLFRCSTGWINKEAGAIFSALPQILAHPNALSTADYNMMIIIKQ